MLIGIPASISLTSCSNDKPTWLSQNLPSGMTIKGNDATIKLSSQPFWITSLTSSSSLLDIANSLNDNLLGLGGLLRIYLSIPSNWTIDFDKGTYGVSVDSEIYNGSYNMYLYFKNSTSGKSTLHLLLTGFSSN